MDSKDIQMAEAPWKLRGKGYMFLYNFPKDWSKKANFLPVEMRGEYQGGLGTLMLVDYATSNVGPYQELLFIPGRFSWMKYRCYAISRIWVSSMASVINGRKNWGIPKNLANFNIEKTGSRQESWSVQSGEGAPFLKADLSYGILPLPIHTAFLPFPLLQAWQGDHFLTKFSGYGVGRLAKLESLRIDDTIFPDITPKKPLLGLRVDPFHIQFPVAHMIQAPEKSQSHQRLKSVGMGLPES